MVQSEAYIFGTFRLDAADQRLWRGDEEVAVAPKYFNALLLMVRHPGQLITKDRFFDQVWEGIVVGDEALTQCIANLRRALGDNPRDPAFIVTVPKRGYRFIGTVEGAGQRERPVSAPAGKERSLAGMVAAATAGGAVAGALGGLYFLIGAADGSGGAAMSALIVLTLLNVAVGALGAFGISLGMAIESAIRRHPPAFHILGAAGGGLVLGTAFHLVATDGLHLLFGSAPARFTGGLEGMTIGVALATGGRLGGGLDSARWRPALVAGAACGLGGILLSVTGGTLMTGSLRNLAGAFDRAQLDTALIEPLAAVGLDPTIGATVTTALEGLLFGLCVVAALLWWSQPRRPHPVIRP
jgi:DNA-binding winged helix-turn-helix (wHTH) protein